MLKVRTRIEESAIHGIGLFADEPIAAGTVIWEYHPHFDISFTEQQLKDLPIPAREQVENYSYYEAEIGAYLLCGDDARFINHLERPNTDEVSEMRTVAVRDIAVGEEITCDYTKLGLEEFP